MSWLKEESLTELERAAKGTDYLMPYILAAVKNYATLGEIANVFREVFGIHRETVVL